MGYSGNTSLNDFLNSPKLVDKLFFSKHTRIAALFRKHPMQAVLYKTNMAYFRTSSKCHPIK